jgi:pimeloyl-ACP methyl ester carboxylesterase
MDSDMVALERDGPSQSVEPVNAVVFIYGIFSSHPTFIPMFRQLAERQDLNDQNVVFLSYDYDFHRSLERNGLAFASALRRRFRDEDRVVVVAHSMGGLVSRLALLSQRMPFVRLLLLLATPNSGAIRISQLGLLSQLAHAGTEGKAQKALPIGARGHRENSNSTELRYNIADAQNAKKCRKMNHLHSGQVSPTDCITSSRARTAWAGVAPRKGCLEAISLVRCRDRCD